MTTLYEHPLSPYAQKVKIALRGKGVKFDLKMPNLLGGDDEFARVSPRREVPTLVDGDDTIFDSTIILEYIEDRWPKPPLLPAEPAARARVRMIEEMCDTYYEAINWAAFEVQIFANETWLIQCASRFFESPIDQPEQLEQKGQARKLFLE